jgi:Zn-dependent protease
MTRLMAAHPVATATTSMALAALGYVPLLGWRVALALIAVLFVHEIGHVAAGRLLRLPLQMLVFIPFLGAFVAFKENARIVEQDAVLALGGPACGAAFAFACGIVALLTGNRYFGLLSFLGAVINLLNMVPLFPLDGGRILAIVSPRLSLLGVPVWGGLLVWHLSYDLLLIAVIALPLLFEALRGDRGEREVIAFYAAPPLTQLCAVAAYLVTAAVLVLSLVMARAARDISTI